LRGSKSRLIGQALNHRGSRMESAHRTSRSLTPSLSHTSRAITCLPHLASHPLYSQSDTPQPPMPSQGLSRSLETSDKSQYTPGVHFAIHKKAYTSRTPSSSSIDPTMIYSLVLNSSQMLTFMMKSNQEQLDLMKQQEQCTAKQHWSQVLALQVPIYKQIICNNDLSDEVQEEAHQALVKLLHGD
jgi:hypothetical protein